MKRSEVRRYRFASPDKNRPVLILTRDSVLDYLGEVTIAPITSTIREIPSEVVLTEEDGMLRTCAVNLDPDNLQGPARCPGHDALRRTDAGSQGSPVVCSRFPE